MANKKDTLMTMKSSEMLYNFLENTNLHKKDFAQMIGVTLSYVYNLIDETIPFSTRSTTLERIATRPYYSRRNDRIYKRKTKRKKDVYRAIFKIISQKTKVNNS